jgi:multiple sugar transport system substrate-binding protein
MRCKPANRVLVALVMGLTVLLCTSQLLAKTHITVLCNWYNVPQQLEIWPQLVAGFNDSQTAIEAEYIPGDGSIDKLKTMIVAGSAPDAVHFDRYRVIELVNDGLLLPVDAYLPPGVNLRTDFIPSTIQEAMWQGRIYALPSSTDIRGLFWNQDLVDAAGLSSSTGPRTWDEVGVYARKLTRLDQANLPVQLGFVPWWGNWGWQGWFWHFGGDYYDYGTNTPTVNRPENVAALSWMQSYAEEYGTPSIFSAAGMTENSHILMAKGKLAMDVAHYGAASGWYLLTTPGLRFWGGHMPQPPGGRNGTWSGGSE